VSSRLVRANMTVHVVHVCATPYMPRSHTPEKGQNSRHGFNTKAVSPTTSPKDRKRVTPKGPQRHCQNQRRTMLTRDHGGATHGEGRRGGWCACGVSWGWGGSQRPQVRFPPFLLGVQTRALAVKQRGWPKEGVARSKHSNFFSVEKSPIPFQQVNCQNVAS
jgi:hypothetical protein